MVFDVTLTSQSGWKLKSTFVQLQNLFLPAGSAAGSSAGFVFTADLFGFSPRMGDTLHRSR